MSNKPRWKITLYAVFAGEILAIAGFSTSTPIIPFFLQDMGVLDPLRLKFLTGLCNALPAISLAVMAPIWGSLADNWGRKPMLLRAMFGGALILVLQGFVNNPWQFLALRIFQGCVTGTVAAATIMVASVAPKKEAGSALGLLQMAVFLGASLGPMFGGLISDLVGHRVTFFATSVLLLVAGMVVYKFAEDDFVPPVDKKSRLRSLIPDLSPLTQSKALWALLAVVAADQIAGSIVGPFLPLYIQSISSSPNLVATTTGIILGAGALSSALAAAVVGKISYRVGYERSLILCLVGAALFTLPQAFAHSAWQLLVLRVISSFFVGGDMPALNALIAQRTEPGKQGSIYGLSSSIASGSGALGPAIGASMAAFAGYTSVFLATGTVLALTGGSVAMFVRRNRDRRSSA